MTGIRSQKTSERWLSVSGGKKRDSSIGISLTGLTSMQRDDKNKSVTYMLHVENTTIPVR